MFIVFLTLINRIDPYKVVDVIGNGSSKMVIIMIVILLLLLLFYMFKEGSP